jgi:hypothetical protein
MTERSPATFAGGCGLCDTEADHMCEGCQRCRCFDHDDCTRPTP